VQNSESNSRLKLHTALTPPEEERQQAPQREKSTEKPIEWKVLPHPKAVKKRRTWGKRKSRLKSSKKQPLTVGEKLMRNGAVACALVLTVMALQRIDQPWSRSATQGLQSALSMDLNLDETLGRLKFVKDMMPESVLVFWNAGGKGSLIQPVKGEVSHAFDAQQPWAEYRCQPGAAVYAAAKGKVVSLGQSARGDWILMLQHEDGLQSVYGYLSRVLVENGQELPAGAQLGVAGEDENARLYFELRENGVSVDPTERMGSGT
jgi:murein DD-endopeptidase MepM/ murein hydrolase activator NlpD